MRWDVWANKKLNWKVIKRMFPRARGRGITVNLFLKASPDLLANEHFSYDKTNQWITKRLNLNVLLFFLARKIPDIFKSCHRTAVISCGCVLHGSYSNIFTVEKIYFSTWIAKGKTENIVFNLHYSETKPCQPLAAGLHAGLSWSNWNLEMLLFVEGRKLENPKKNPWS